MNAADYERFLAAARRFARRPDEAEDLLQEALLAAIAAGRLDLSLDENRAWLHGVLRNRATMDARTASRRRKRENTSARPNDTVAVTVPALDRLSRSARQVALLAAHGMTPDEIMHALSIAPTAFRQRLTTIRRALRGAAGEHAPSPRDPGLELGLIRRALLTFVREHPGVGTHDPDGHLLVFLSQRPPPRQRR